MLKGIFKAVANVFGGSDSTDANGRSRKKVKGSQYYGVCAQCNEDIYGDYTAALGKKYHLDHFECSSCSSSIRDGRFYRYNGEPYCDECYQRVKGFVCAACDGVVKDGLSFETHDRIFHEACFKCEECKGLIKQGEKFFSKVSRKDGTLTIFCKDHQPATKKSKVRTITETYESKAADTDDKKTSSSRKVKRKTKDPSMKCEDCGKDIEGDHLKLGVLGRFHVDCCNCCECGCSLKTIKAFEYKGKLYCREHYKFPLADPISAVEYDQHGQRRASERKVAAKRKRRVSKA